MVQVKNRIKSKVIFGISAVFLSSCHWVDRESPRPYAYEDVKIVGAIRNVMWKGELGSRIDLDTISNRDNLYGLGPVSGLTGELLIKDGTTYISRVTTDSTMTVEKSFNVSAPFFVYTNVREWKEIPLPEHIRSTGQLEKFIDTETQEYKRPFSFKLMGTASAAIHVQNLPNGTRVSSPEEAHMGQTDYSLIDESVEVVGFFSREHQGVFTHHDSFLHMHLISEDESKMGHVDELKIGKMTLYLPVR